MALAQTAALDAVMKPAGPFLKWAGGKGQLLVQLSRFMPRQINGYFEPFLGSGAVFFHLRANHGFFPAVLIDTNEDLINCFSVVKRSLGELIPLLRRHQEAHSKAFYYDVRGKDPKRLTEIQRAARFIYLNKTCYNGLYRVNSKGLFNVPMGSYERPKIFDEENLRAVSAALRNTKLMSGDFSFVLNHATRGDCVYFDPPYFSDSAGFTGYAVAPSGRAAFDAFQHRMLFNVATTLNERGCHIVISNSDTEYIRRLYKKGRDFSQHVVTARRFINCDAGGRQQVNELVITNR